jgi:hypothetical protein
MSRTRFLDTHSPANGAAGQAVVDFMRSVYGRRAIADRLVNRRVTEAPANWLQGILAGRQLVDGLRQVLVEYALSARADGIPWDALAAPLGVTDTNRRNPGVAAFEFVVAEQTTRSRGAVYWQCSSCTNVVADYGPDDPDPERNQRDHADDCPRHAAEIATYSSERRR